MTNLQITKGMRDFPPEEKIVRDEIASTIKQSFELYGFNPIETPILERYETLAAKFAAGEESDALKETFKLTDQGKRELGLRFDLTVPFCRFVGMNPNFKAPFKKYCSGNVFRDGPIKTGRYRQFMQMDPDIVGAKSMLADAEILSLTETIFGKLGFDVVIELNNRKIIDGVMDSVKIPEKDRFNVIISIDKLKKAGEDNVRKELKEKGLKDNQIKKIISCFKAGKDNNKTLANLRKLLKNVTGKEGVKETEELLDYLDMFNVKNVVFNPSLARGLAYYTGPVFEVFMKDSGIKSSIAAGGRYDKIIGSYLQTNKEFPATGISFGIDVITEALKEKKRVAKKSVVKVFVIPIGTLKESIKVVQRLRGEGINADFDIAGRGISKNLQYVDSYEIPYAVFIGGDELKMKKVKLRDMKSGKEEMVSVEDVVKRLKE
ncbi:histidine--tRNA ligase [Candidatus Woesearchaeota archaeon]|nr:histidine--tRNA ligase [Candidatus Woesearchaeota archaeon]|tara:strand:- start:2164 stop:3462 length:1299 start_codon:yes stop_codon:yes gene_type:complete